MVAKCTHVSEKNAEKLRETIKANFQHDISHYTRHGQLSLENGVYDMEHRSAQELFLRNERRTKLMDELQVRRDDWPSILKGMQIITLEKMCQRGIRVKKNENFLFVIM